MDKSNRALIELVQLGKTYHINGIPHPVLNNISLSIHAGSMFAVVGSSGSGKSTLMNIIGLLDKASCGEYYLNGQNIAALTSNQLACLRNQSIGFVFQQFNLLPHFSAVYNVALPLIYRKQSIHQALKTAALMLKRVSMHAFAEHHPSKLSGGQQQRVALARALVGEPQLILADEPTGALDSKTGQEMMNLFHELHQEGRTLLLITHDEQIATQCPERLVLADGSMVR